MEKQIRRYRSSSIQYYVFGNGPEWLFCFHGYGETGKLFEPLEPLLGEQYTLIAIDMPFHGETDWQEGTLLEPAWLIDIINTIKPPEQKMSLLGYSLGGRVVLQLLLKVPQVINKVILVAGDGMRNNRWQKFATRTLLGNRLFRFTMHYPAWIFSMVYAAGKLGLYNKSFIKFVHYYLDNKEKRLLLYKRWLTLRRFNADLEKVRANILQYHIPVQLLFGKYDRIILSKHGYAFAKGIEQYIHITELEAGHTLLQPKYLPQLAPFFA